MKIKYFLLLICLILLTNLIWEFLHYPLYFDFSGMAKYPRLILASFGDLLLITLILAINSLKNRNMRWLNKPSKFDYIIIVLAGIIIAVIVELNALARGDWAYKKSMPTVSNVGLTPLLQLFTTAIISLKIFNYLSSKKK